MKTISNYLAELLKLPEDLQASPPITEKTQINIDISSFCNQKCIYCVHHHLGEHEHGCFIDDKLFYRVAREAFDLGIREIGLYSAGEPFTNPKLFDYVVFLKALGFNYVFISTNGLLCTSKNLENLVASGIDSIKFSISAVSEESFNAHHGVPGFEKTYTNLKYTWEYRKTHNYKYKIFIYSIITKQNINDVEQMRKIFEPYCDEFLSNRMENSLNLYTGCERIFENKDYVNLSSAIKHSLPCPSLFNKLYVSAEGRLHTCQYTLMGLNAIATSVADLHEISLKEAYYSDVFGMIRKKHISGNIENTICNRCINGVVEPMYSMQSGFCEPFTMDSIDISADVNRAFP